ncbi:MAG: WecB/TagA/CpsF family glycosyltransferase [Acidobacteria bacterium]|nr:WecB/TagA/CpsF family glycosyltransferase [Acidobacteriota bacterium]
MPTVLGVSISASSYATLAEECTEWARKRESRTVLFVGMHGLMEAHDDPALRHAMNAADLSNPDGMPVVWAMRTMGFPEASRVYGPDATVELLSAAEKGRIPIGFYGADESTLANLISEVERRHPAIHIAFKMSPPFRPLTASEDEEVVRNITDSGARWLFVGLGCPKQEKWVLGHKNQIPAVMLAVGAAFDFLAGTKSQAPRWMMRSGLEWAFRLASEPRRLAGRYLKNVPRFALLLGWQLLTRNGRRGNS